MAEQDPKQTINDRVRIILAEFKLAGLPVRGTEVVYSARNIFETLNRGYGRRLGTPTRDCSLTSGFTVPNVLIIPDIRITPDSFNIYLNLGFSESHIKLNLNEGSYTPYPSLSKEVEPKIKEILARSGFGRCQPIQY